MTGSILVFAPPVSLTLMTHTLLTCSAHPLSLGNNQPFQAFSYSGQKLLFASLAQYALHELVVTIHPELSDDVMACGTAKGAYKVAKELRKSGVDLAVGGDKKLKLVLNCGLLYMLDTYPRLYGQLTAPLPSPDRGNVEMLGFAMPQTSYQEVIARLSTLKSSGLMTVVITGSSYCSQGDEVAGLLRKVFSKRRPDFILTGGRKGVEVISADWARRRFIPTLEYWAPSMLGQADVEQKIEAILSRGTHLVTVKQVGDTSKYLSIMLEQAKFYGTPIRELVLS